MTRNMRFVWSVPLNIKLHAEDDLIPARLPRMRLLWTTINMDDIQVSPPYSRLTSYTNGVSSRSLKHGPGEVFCFV